MSELPQITERDIPRPYPNLRFEPGDHGANADLSKIGDTSPAYDRYQQGDPNSHIWNTSLADRIKETKPKIIAIDGLELSETLKDDGPPQFGAELADRVWFLMPTTPEQINPDEKSVYVVNGDAILLGEPFNVSIQANPELQNIRKALNNKVNEDYDNMKQDLLREERALVLALGLVTTALGIKAGVDVIKKKETVLSR